MPKGKAIPEKGVETYNRALRALARMRRTGEPLTAAAREARIDPRTVKKYLAPELRGLADGRTQASRTDRRRRTMLVPTEQGTAPVVIRGSEQASLLGRYMSAVGKYLRTGDTEGLVEFEGQSIGEYTLVTDPEVLTTLAQAGSLELDSIYALPESSS